MNQKEHSLLAQFEEQVRMHPDVIPSAFEGTPLSYAAINARANQLAHYLTRQGIGPGSVVAVLEDHAPDMIVTLLGILKAGGTHLPIKTQQPKEHILATLWKNPCSMLIGREQTLRQIPFTKLNPLPNLSEQLVVTDPRPQIEDLDSLPFPDRSLIDYKKYDQYIGGGCLMHSINVLATRGCPYQCLYCHRIWPKRHVLRSARNIFEETKLHYDRGYREFSFMDDIFNLNRQNSMEFFELVIRHNLNIHIEFAMGLRGDILTPDYIDLMAEAGVMNISLALETASPRLQKLIHKYLDIEKLRDNLRYVWGKYPYIITDLCTMYGFPTETEEEALMTLDFIKSITWLHFPFIFALKIYLGTPMARFALENGVKLEDIEKSVDLPFHELSYTMPFSVGFARNYKADFINDYVLNPERLHAVIQYQKQVLTREEITAKYNSFLPGRLDSFPAIAALIGDDGFFEAEVHPIELASDSFQAEADGGLRVVFLDLSQHFSDETDQLHDVIEAPLGLLYLLTYLKRELGDRIHGTILKALIDFDSFEELRNRLDTLRPQAIGIRTLSMYKNFFHYTIALLKQWYPQVTIIAGGPYATSEYTSLLADRNIALAVLGEGEFTILELLRAMIEHGGQLPDEEVLRQIQGIAFLPQPPVEQRERAETARKVLLLNYLAQDIEQESRFNTAAANGSMSFVQHLPAATGDDIFEALVNSPRRFEEHEGYWRSKLAGMPDVLRLPYDTARKHDAAEVTRSREELILNVSLVEKLQQLALRRNTPMSAMMLSVATLFLYQLSKQGDFCVGLLLPDTSYVVPLRMRPAEEMEFDALLEYVAVEMSEAVEQAGYPIDLPCMPNILYEFGSTNHACLDKMRCDLAFLVCLRGQALQVVLTYDSHVFFTETIRRFLAILHRFARIIVEP